MTEDYPDEVEAAEDLTHADVDPGDPEVPEADALEQRRDVRTPPEERPERIEDRPEADALDQARGAGDDDEEDDRR